MEKIKNNFKIIGYFLIGLLLIAFISTLFNYFTNLGSGFLNTFNILTLGVMFFIICFKKGKNTMQKGFLCGLKTSLLLVFIMLLISLIFFTKDIKLTTFLYYGILILIGMFGGSFGKNKKKEN